MCVTLPHRPGTISNINRDYTVQIQNGPVASNIKGLLLLLFFLVVRYETKEEDRMEDILLLHRNDYEIQGW